MVSSHQSSTHPGPWRPARVRGRRKKNKFSDPPGFHLPRLGLPPKPARVFPAPPGSVFVPHHISFPPHSHLTSPLHILPPSISLSSSITIKLPKFLSSNSPLFLHQNYLKISPSFSSSHSLSHSLLFFHQFLHSFNSPSFHISLFIFNFSPQTTLAQFLLLSSCPFFYSPHPPINSQKKKKINK